MHGDFFLLKGARSTDWLAGMLVFVAISVLQCYDLEPGYVRVGYPMTVYVRYDRAQICTGPFARELLVDVSFAVVLVSSVVRVSRKLGWHRVSFRLPTLLALVSAAGSYEWIRDQQVQSWLDLPVALSMGLVFVALVAAWYTGFELTGLVLSLCARKLREQKWERSWLKRFFYRQVHKEEGRSPQAEQPIQRQDEP